MRLDHIYCSSPEARMFPHLLLERDGSSITFYPTIYSLELCTDEMNLVRSFQHTRKLSSFCRGNIFIVFIFIDGLFVSSFHNNLVTLCMFFFLKFRRILYIRGLFEKFSARTSCRLMCSTDLRSIDL